MQRKNYFLTPLFFIVILFVLANCATAGGKDLFGGSPIAVVSLVSNQDINWKDEAKSDLRLTSRSQRRAMQGDSDQTLVSEADLFIDETGQVIFSVMETSPFISFAPKADVLNAVSYKNAPSYYVQEKAEMAKPAGFRYINFRDKKFLSEFAAETGADKMLFINLNITKFMASGIGKNGSFRVSAVMSVMLKDERGKTLFNKSYEALSRDSSKVSNGMYSESELERMILMTVEDACYYFLDDIR